MEIGRIEEGVIGVFVDFGDVGSGRCCEVGGRGVNRSEDVCGAGDGGLSLVAVFGHKEEGGGDQRGRGGDIVGFVYATACADDVAEATVIVALVSWFDHGSKRG